MEWTIAAVMGAAIVALAVVVGAVRRRVARVEARLALRPPAPAPCPRVHLSDLPLWSGDPAVRAVVRPRPPPRDEDETNPVLP